MTKLGRLKLLGIELSRAAVSGLFRRPTVGRRSAMLALTLVAIFSLAILMRIFPAKYGFYLNEFDPYFDFRGASFIVDHFNQRGIPGLFDYFSWVDKGGWYPEGRNVASTAQGGLQFAGALTYLFFTKLFAVNLTLYDFLVLFPVFVGALAALFLFLLVKKIGGTTAGLFASLLFTVSPPILQRGSLGWYKSEPLAFLLATLAGYLFLSIYDEKTSHFGTVWRATIAGFLLGYANTSWGGSYYFTVIFGAVLLVAPFLNIDHRKTVYAAGALVPATLIFSAFLPRPGIAIFTNPAGAVLLASLAFVLSSYFARRWTDPRNYVRTLGKLLVGLGILGLASFSFGIVSGLSGRYLTVIYPFERTSSALVESVAEHFVPTGSDYFSSFVIIMFLSAFGVIMIIRKRTIQSVFALLAGVGGIYIASSFSRLLVYASFGFLILGAIGFSELSSTIIRPSPVQAVKKRPRPYEAKAEAKVFYSVAMIGLLVLPAVYPASNWISTADFPVSIANSSVGFRSEISDWREALNWMRENTPAYQPGGKPTIIMAWWDYGYWITVMANRTTLSDNATFNGTRIALIAKAFMSSENDALKIIHQLKADYVVVFMAALKFEQSGQSFYFLQDPRSGAVLGGDESKKQWFIRIAGLNISQFLYPDEFTPQQNFWDNTLVGKMFPLTQVGFLNTQGQITTVYAQGSVGVYSFMIKYPKDGTGPLKLVFASSSLEKPISVGSSAAAVTAVLVYQVVK